MNDEINLAWMYPDILNLHGERANAQCFQRIADNLNIKLNILRIDDIEEIIDFSNLDILLFNCGELKVLPTILKSLNNQIEKLAKYVHSKKTIIATGTTGALLGNTISRYDGSSFTGLNLLDMNIKERKTVIGDDIYFSLDDGTEIIGSQIQMIDISLSEGQAPLGKIKYGYGNNGIEHEGAIKDNIIFTNCLGPCFVKNPWFAEKILRNVCKQKNIKIDDSKSIYEIETKSLQSTKEFIQKKLSSN